MSRAKSDPKDTAQRELAAKPIQLGIYRHYKGDEYVVYTESLDEATLRPLVHYYSIAKKTRWTRSRRNFCAWISERGRKGPVLHRKRFSFVRKATDGELVTAAGFTDIATAVRSLRNGLLRLLTDDSELPF